MGNSATGKRILVTGAAGFVGANLCERFLNEGTEVIGLDMASREEAVNVQSFLQNKNFTYVQHDIIEPLTLEGRLDEIYNFATIAAPKYYQEDRIHTLKTSVYGAVNLLELATEKGARILQSSTSEIYGDPLEHPQKESYRGNVSTTGVRACYDEGKRAAETLFVDYHRHRGTDVKIIRIFNVYGPHMKDDGRIMANFIQQALRGEPITIYGDGSQTRSFMYIDDLIEGIERMMQKEDFIGPVNLGNPVEYTVKEIAEMVVSFVESKSPIVYKPLPQDDPTKRKPDITLAKEMLDWEPTVSLEEGLAKTTSYYKGMLGA